MTFVRLSDSGFYQREIFWFLIVAFMLHAFIQLLDHQIDQNTPFTRHAFSLLHRHRPWLTHLFLITFLSITGWQSLIITCIFFLLFTFLLWRPTKKMAKQMARARQAQLLPAPR
nr:hypothetical protein [Armatimonas sp.]